MAIQHLVAYFVSVDGSARERVVKYANNGAACPSPKTDQRCRRWLVAITTVSSYKTRIHVRDVHHVIADCE